MHPLKAWIGPLHREKKKMGWVGVLKVSVDAGLKQLKVISRGEDGGSIFIQFDSKGVLSVRKAHVSSKDGFRGDN